MSEKMPRAIRTQTYDNISGKCNFKYVHLKQYDLGGGVWVRLKKERASFTKEAGWGLEAVTAIPKDFVLGCFAVKTSTSNFYVHKILKYLNIIFFLFQCF
jgi:hypothetical protein